MSEFAFDTLSAVEDFKRGTTPVDAVEQLNVGREVWHDGTLFYLDKFVPKDRGVVRFVMGRYGEGKTHFLYLTAKAALDKHYVVTYVSAERANLDRFDFVYRELVASLRTPDMPNDLKYNFKTTTNGLKNILDNWVEEQRIRHSLDVREADEIDDATSSKIRSDIDSLDRERIWDAGFRHAIQHYLANAMGGTEDGAEQNATILQWLQGDPLPRALTKDFDVYEPIKAANSKDIFRSLVLMLKEFGFRGLVLLVDELERTLLQTPKARIKAYQNIRQLLDNADKSGALATYVLCAITPELLHNDKGFKEYDALIERIGPVALPGGTQKYIDKRAIVIDLGLTPFDKPQLVELARKIRAIHADAMEWEASERVTDEVITTFVEELHPREVEISKPRLLVRAMTQILERAEQDPGYNPMDDMTGEIAEAFAALQAQRKQEQQS